MARKKSKDKNDKPEDDKSSAPQFNDVAKPGETPALPTSKPVITGHGSMLKQDPMVAGNPDEDSPQQTDEPKILPKKNEVTLEPVDSEQPQPEENSDKTEEPEATMKTESTPEEPATSEGQPAKDDALKSAEENEAGSDSAAIDSLATSAEAKKLEEKVAEEEQKKNAKIQELIAGRKYFLPIIEGGHKASSQRFMTWLLIILLLAAAGAYLAIDSGHLDVGISLPFDLIKN